MEEGSRYDGQIAVLGNEFQKKLSNLKYFLVGAGAIGCEMLKNWACMGLGTGPQGSILVTDNDIIEISNLNRQFLYRAWDVQHSKSETSAKAAVVMNPAMKIKANERRKSFLLVVLKVVERRTRQKFARRLKTCLMTRFGLVWTAFATRWTTFTLDCTSTANACISANLFWKAELWEPKETHK